jgi:predicted nucleic acid-binding protein
LTAKRNNITPYDAIFVCVALKLQLALKTLDKKQMQYLNLSEEKNRKNLILKSPVPFPSAPL